VTLGVLVSDELRLTETVLEPDSLRDLTKEPETVVVGERVFEGVEDRVRVLEEVTDGVTLAEEEADTDCVGLALMQREVLSVGVAREEKDRELVEVEERVLEAQDDEDGDIMALRETEMLPHSELEADAHAETEREDDTEGLPLLEELSEREMVPDFDALAEAVTLVVVLLLTVEELEATEAVDAGVELKLREELAEGQVESVELTDTLTEALLEVLLEALAHLEPRKLGVMDGELVGEADVESEGVLETLKEKVPEVLTEPVLLAVPEFESVEEAEFALLEEALPERDSESVVDSLAVTLTEGDSEGERAPDAEEVVE
jgi:hypothetical protein